MMTIMRISLCGLIAIGTGCALFIPKETRYLQSVEGKATQEQVKQELGTPKKMTVMPTGESEWLYEVREIEPGAQSTWATAGSWCDEYYLTFDASGVLRQWSHKSYFHGGELMPRFCNNNIGVQKPAL